MYFGQVAGKRGEMGNHEMLNDAEFLRWVANVGQTARCEEVMARREVIDRLRDIADRVPLPELDRKGETPR